MEVANSDPTFLYIYLAARASILHILQCPIHTTPYLPISLLPKQVHPRGHSQGQCPGLGANTSPSTWAQAARDPGEGSPIWPQALPGTEGSQLGLAFPIPHKLIRQGLRQEQKVGELFQVQATVVQAIWELGTEDKML